MRLQFLIASFAICGAAAAQQFPSRPVHFIVTTAAGGTSDITARLVGRHLEKRLGQPVIVENKIGASGTIAGNYVKSAAPDGYNLLVGGMGMSSTFVASNAVNPEKDLLPVSNLQNGAFFLFVRSSLPVRSLAELIAWSKANPGKLNYGASSSLTTLAAEALKLKTGVTFAVIPYKGAAPIVPAMLSGDADFTIDSLPTFQPQVQADKVRVLIVTSAKRSPMLPSVPSAAEAGLGEFESGFYLGLWAPLGTPRDAIQRLSSETAAVMKIPEVVEHLRSIGTEAVGSTPEELLRTHLALNRVLDDAARASGFQPQ
jgi:tripartite-type tricarboxylate transporter receptor subunit TctC